MDQGELRREDRFHGGRHVGGIAHRPGTLDRRIGEGRLIRLGQHHVPGKLQRHRPESPRPQVGEGAPHEFRDAVDSIHAGHPLGDLLEVEDGVEVGLHPRPALGHPAGQKEDGGGIRIGLGQSPEGVLGPRAVLHGADADAATAGRAGVSIGHAQDCTLGPGHDRPDPQLRPGVDHLVDGKAEEALDPFLFQDTGNRCCTFHWLSPVWVFDWVSGARSR